MAVKAWLEGLKPGDEVAVDVGRGLGCRWHIVTVERRTATQIVCVYRGGHPEVRFRAADGHAVSRDRWNRRVMEPLTDEVRAAVQREADLATVRYAKWETVPDATLRSVCALLAAPSSRPEER
jgi:hypothetical protein